MNRNEAIEQAANEIAMALTRKGYVNIKNGKDEPRIDALYKALAMPKDAERVALVRDVEVWTTQDPCFVKCLDRY